MKWLHSEVRVFKLAFEPVDDILNTDFKYVRFLHFGIYTFNIASCGHFVFSGDFAKLAITFADVDRFYRNSLLCFQ